MPRELQELADTKGRKLVLNTGNGTNPDRTFVFKQNGEPFDISAFGAVNFIVKELGGAIGDANIPAFNCPVISAPDGTVNVPFSTLNISGEKEGEGLVAVIFEVTGGKKIPHAYWAVDIVNSEVE